MWPDPGGLREDRWAVGDEGVLPGGLSPLPTPPIPRHITISQGSQPLDNARCWSIPQVLGYWTPSWDLESPCGSIGPTHTPRQPVIWGKLAQVTGPDLLGQESVPHPAKGEGRKHRGVGERLSGLDQPPFHPGSTSGGGSSPPEVTHTPHLTLISASEPSWEGQPPSSPSRQGALGGPLLQPQFPPRGLAL